MEFTDVEQGNYARITNLPFDPKQSWWHVNDRVSTKDASEGNLSDIDLRLVQSMMENSDGGEGVSLIFQRVNAPHDPDEWFALLIIEGAIHTGVHVTQIPAGMGINEYEGDDFERTEVTKKVETIDNILDDD
jgi:hypothetical protein